MERGLYIAATGMLSAVTRQDVIANNLANVSTVGFKGDRVVNESFGDKLLHGMRTGAAVGRMSFGTRVAGTVTDFGQGAMRSTGNKLDVAIGGDGFFSVRMNDGTVAYTRNGQFARTPDGFLTTQEGELLLGPDRLPVFVGASGDPVIQPDGQIIGTDGQPLGRLGIVTLDIPNARKIGDNKWAGVETGGMPATTSLRQGFTEASGVNSVKEMVEMISTMRTYESTQRVVTSIDGTLDKAVNSIGQLG